MVIPLAILSETVLFLATLQLHRSAIASLIEERLPDPNWAGVGIFDFEDWRPLFDNNYDSLSGAFPLPFTVLRMHVTVFPLPFTVFPQPFTAFPLPSSVFHCLSLPFPELLLLHLRLSGVFEAAGPRSFSPTLAVLLTRQHPTSAGVFDRPPAEIPR